jgi:hypothetical protein
MKNVSEIINRQSHQAAPTPLSEVERDSVAYFFFRLKLIDPKFYDEIMPDETTERLVKREHANMIRTYSREKIDKGMKGLKHLLGTNHPDFKRLTISKIVGLISNGGSPDCAPAGIYKYSGLPALPDKSVVEKSRAAGAEALPRLLGMFEE